MQAGRSFSVGVDIAAAMVNHCKEQVLQRRAAGGRRTIGGTPDVPLQEDHLLALKVGHSHSLPPTCAAPFACTAFNRRPRSLLNVANSRLFPLSCRKRTLTTASKRRASCDQRRVVRILQSSHF